MRRWILFCVAVLCQALLAVHAVAQFSFFSGEQVNYQVPGNTPAVLFGFPPPIVGDFNNDGHADILISVISPANRATGFALLLGDGHGGFQSKPPVFPSAATTATNAVTYPQMFTGDFNRDGNVDVVLFQGGPTLPSGQMQANAVLYLGNGDGTFKDPVDISKYVGVLGLGVFDTRGNGKLDLVSQAVQCQGVDPSCTIGPVTVALGNGDGTFQDVSNIGSTIWKIGRYGWSGADLGNGHLDLLANNDSGGFLPFLGNGDGTFQELPIEDAAATNFGWALGRFIRNHPPSLLIDYDDHFLMKTGEDGTFPDSTTFDDDLYLLFRSFAVGDVNGDGIDDIVFLGLDPQIIPRYRESFGWMLGNGDGTFAPAHLFPSPPIYGYTGEPSSLALADFTGSGRLDLIATYVSFDGTSSFMYIFFNNLTTTTLSSNANPQIFSNPIKLKANVSGNAIAPNGNPIDFTGGVSFYDNGNLLGRRPVLSGAATFTNLILSAGTHNLTANYTGDLVFSPSAPASLSQVVNGIPTSISLTSSTATTNHDDSVTFAATISAPGEPLGKLPNRSTGIGLYFYNNGNLIGGRPVDASGTASITTTFRPGTHQITVKYLGDSYWAPSTSNIVTEQVN
jgi:hypothetical protein